MEIKNDIYYLLSALKNKDLKYELFENIEDDIDKGLKYLRIGDSKRYLTIQDNSEEKKEEFTKEFEKFFYELLEELKEEEIFPYYYIIKKLGFYPCIKKLELIEVLANSKHGKKLIEDAIKLLNDYEKLPEFEVKGFEDIGKLKRSIGFVPSIYNPANFLISPIYYCESYDFIKLIQKLKVEAYIYLFSEFPGKKFLKSLPKVRSTFKSNDKRFLYNFTLSLNHVLVHEEHYIKEVEEVEDYIKKIISENLSNIGKYIFNEVYISNNALEYRTFSNKIFKEILAVPTKREEYLSSLTWGKDFEDFFKYMSINENFDNKFKISDEAYYSTKAFLESYDYKKESFFNYSLHGYEKVYCKLMVVALGFGLLNDESYLEFLEKELKRIKYQYFSCEIGIIVDLNRKVGEILTMHLLLKDAQLIERITQETQKSALMLINEIVLEQFIFNLKGENSITLPQEDFLFKLIKNLDEDKEKEEYLTIRKRFEEYNLL